jgi:hypothetical protein
MTRWSVGAAPQPSSQLPDTDWSSCAPCLCHSCRVVHPPPLPHTPQVFTSLYNSDDNCFVCAPTGSGKTICAGASPVSALSELSCLGMKAEHTLDTHPQTQRTRQTVNTRPAMPPPPTHRVCAAASPSQGAAAARQRWRSLRQLQRGQTPGACCVRCPPGGAGR